MEYLIGDIHGMVHKLRGLYRKLAPHVTADDTLIFIGDYIDRGRHSYEVVEFLIRLAEKYRVVFLKGNHEEMLISYINGRDQGGVYLFNGGTFSIDSYKPHGGIFHLPARHQDFFNALKLYYEGTDFIAVHAGLNPEIPELSEQTEHDMLWIREGFYRKEYRWPKTIVFGHTPTYYINGARDIYHDVGKNIVGIDTGAVYGGPLTCLRMPDWELFQV